MRACGTCSCAVKREDDGLLECRRHAIRVVGIDEDGDPVCCFPVVAEDEFCMEWQRGDGSE